MDASGLLQRIEDSGIRDYASRTAVSKIILQAGKEASVLGVPASLAVALDNSDTCGCLLEILKIEQEKFLAGMEIAALALAGSGESVITKTLYIPEYAADFAKFLEESVPGQHFNIALGIVDMRSIKGVLLLHPATLAMLTDRLDGAGEYQYLSVNGGALQKAEAGTKINALLDSGNAKAIQLGCGFYPKIAADMSIDDAAITNGVVRALTDKECMIAEVSKSLNGAQRQHCGKCVFCREGLVQLTAMHRDIMDGKGKAEYLDLIKEIGESMNDGSFCSLGRSASLTALSGIEHFADEYESHIKRRNCPAGVCVSFVTVYIDPDICTGCAECLDVCPVDCIEGKDGYIHMIDETDCTRCGKCMETCPENAVNKTSSKPPKLPDRLTRRGKFKKH